MLKKNLSKELPKGIVSIILGTVLFGAFLVSNHRLFHTLTTQSKLVPKRRSQTFICPTKTHEQLLPDSKSQDQEDFILLRWAFDGLCGGTYIEMGALDGVTFSNSYLFNKQFNWKGLLIEPSPAYYEQLVQNRPNEIALVHAAVCDSEQTLHFVNNGAVGGIYEFAPQSFRDQWWPGVTFDSPNVQEVTCKTLQKIIQQHFGDTTYFDFFSLDVEGAELQVLQSIDFNKVTFGIIFLEADDHNTQKNAAVQEFLGSKGYSYAGFEARSDWFIHNDFKAMY